MLSEARICFGQKLLEEDFRGKGLVQDMDRLLFKDAAADYDVYLAVANKENATSRSFLQKSEYRWVGQDDFRDYYCKSLLEDSSSHRDAERPNSALRIEVRLGEAEDAEDLHALNKKWMREARLGDVSKGFLACVYSAEEFLQIIKKRQIVVADSIQSESDARPVRLLQNMEAGNTYE